MNGRTVNEVATNKVYGDLPLQCPTNSGPWTKKADYDESRGRRTES